ncbi:hypothetical protein G3I44_06325 [Halogeometricum borinquense]|uniref:CopG family transcriptional regulator n=1 Tax=Halogeometricum borinquense TaxID=60847 RepID=A0A6C0UI26_9EURY|nr:hypothetical protein [Halogeometricum borinquense]QIB73941.1 hypothetical protein G3I44_06325 [Halogeometricum borinquense]
MNTNTSDSLSESDTREVSLPVHILDRIEGRLPRSNFDTSDEYVAYVLEEVLSRVEDASDDEYESVDEREVESRLKSLGYME